MLIVFIGRLCGTLFFSRTKIWVHRFILEYVWIKVTVPPTGTAGTLIDGIFESLFNRHILEMI